MGPQKLCFVSGGSHKVQEEALASTTNITQQCGRFSLAQPS